MAPFYVSIRDEHDGRDKKGGDDVGTQFAGATFRLSGAITGIVGHFER